MDHACYHGAFECMQAGVRRLLQKFPLYRLMLPALMEYKH